MIETKCVCVFFSILLQIDQYLSKKIENMNQKSSISS